MDQLPTPHILLVEDEALVRIVALEGLEAAGYTVLPVDSADQALEILADRSDVTILFTDVNMPGALDGLDLAEQVHARWPAIRLVVTSGRGLARRIPDEGRFLPKPYSVTEMTDLIDRVASRGPADGEDA